MMSTLKGIMVSTNVISSATNRSDLYDGPVGVRRISPGKFLNVSALYSILVNFKFKASASEL